MATNAESMKPAPTTENVVWFDISVANLGRAIAFYTAVLQRPIARVDTPHGALGILPHDAKITGGCLVEEANYKAPSTGPLLYFNCTGRLEAAVQAATANGGRIVTPISSIEPHGFRAIVLDSEGNRIALHAPTR